jgi:hypothetical protein
MEQELNQSIEIQENSVDADVEERLTVEVPTEIQAGAFVAAWCCDYAA